ncbi:MAG: hypothetical protein V4754_07445 [Pseudomonadota bacterium]
MYKVKLIVWVKSGSAFVRGYFRELNLPFIPSLGMQFKKGTSTWLWETQNGEIAPKVEAVVYDIDEDLFACLFIVDQELKSSFWTDIDIQSMEAQYFLQRN